MVPLASAGHQASDFAGEEDLAALPARLDQIDAWIEQGMLDDASLLGQLADLAPHGDDFDAPPSTEAQDAVICVDVAVRHARGLAVDPGVVHYAVEP